jgi:TP901 family phage tail tape measure protein
MAEEKIGITLSVDINDFKSALSEAGKAVSTLAGNLKNDLGIALVNVANDENKLKSSTDAAAGELRQQEKVVEGLSGSFKNLSSQLSQVGRNMETKFSGLKDTALKVKDVGTTMGTTFTAAGGAILAGLGLAVNKASNFEQAMADIKAVSGATGDQMSQIATLAKQMGAATKYSSIESAKGIEELIKAGVSLDSIMNGGLKGALDLATAGNLGLADAAEIASTALNAFKSDNLSVTDAANLLAGAANASATDVGELKYGLSAVSAVASGVGLSFKDTSTTLAVFAQNGLKGSDAGTSLKTMLMNLQPTTEAQSKAFEKLGLLTKDGASIFYDANGSIKSMSDIAGILQDKLGGLNDAQRQMALETIFGSDAIRAGNILYKEGAKGVTDMYAAMSNVTAAEVAAEKTNTFKGQLEALNGSFETFQTNIGEALLPIMKILADTIKGLTDWFANLSPEAQKFIAISGALVGVTLVAAGGFAFLAVALGTVATAQWAVILPMMATIGVVLLVIAAVIAITVVIMNNWDTIVSVTKNAWDWIKNITVTVFTSIWDFIKTIWNNVKVVFETMFNAIVTILKAGWEIIKTLFATAFLAVYYVVTGQWDELGKLFSAAFNKIKDILSGTWDEIKRLFTNAFVSIVDGVSSAWDKITSAFSDGWDKVKTWVAGLWNDTKEMGKNLILGMIDGIKNVAGNLINAAKDAVSGAVDGAKKFLGIKSPSRVFMEIGAFTGEGFAVGLDKSQSDVMAATKSMSNSAISAVDTAQGLTTSRVPTSQNQTIILELDGRVIARNTLDYMGGTFRVRGAVT